MLATSQSELTFQSGGKPIRVDAYLPETPSVPLPTVVALHGAGGNVSGMERYASALAAQGFAVYVLHYFDRTGTESADKPTILRNFPLWMKTLWDAISFVETQPRVDRERIALLGFSLGAYLSLANSAIDHRVKAVVEFFGGMPKEMHLFMRRLCPVLILHGEADPTIPVEEAYQLQKLLEKKGIPHEIKIYSGAGHGFEDEAIWRDAGLRSLQFLQKYLNA
ncbi:MAG: dienelactone hydrolase family protein [Acidobacteriia bacterium]|nr:dienelactone hydrolase family protein [Terriglobia bacterium]